MTGLEGFAVVALLFLGGLFVVFVALAWAFVRGARAMERTPDDAGILGLSGAADTFTDKLAPIALPAPYVSRRDASPSPAGTDPQP
jgi:hypothetical protein